MPRVIGKNLSDSAISANVLADAERSLRDDRGLFSVHPAWCKDAYMTGQPYNFVLELAFRQALGCPIREDNCRDTVAITPSELDIGALCPRVIFGTFQKHGLPLPNMTER